MLAFFFNTMWIIPLIPSGLYFAEGLVINSMVLIELDGGVVTTDWAVY